MPKQQVGTGKDSKPDYHIETEDERQARWAREEADYRPLIST